MKKRYLILVAMVVFVASLLVANISRPQQADAAFNKNNLMDDYVFENQGAMSAGQINNFLNSFPHSCISPNSGFEAREPAGYSPSGGFTYGGFVSAGQVIAKSAQVYGINPQVLLVTLQKEQSLVVGGSSYCNNGSQHKYAAAMGYGCPDSGGSYNWSGVSLYRRNGNEVTSTGNTCVNTQAKAGFSQQTIRAAWLLRFGQQRSKGNVNWAVVTGSWDNSDDPGTCYGGPMTQGDRKRCLNGATSYYDGFITIDGESVHMDTGATAALYWYTPHFHGNQNFVAIFEAWFGPVSGQGFVKAISDDPSDLRQWVIYANIKQYIPDSQTVNAWGLGSVPLTTMPASQLTAIPTGPNLGRLMVLNDGSPTIYFVDGGKRYKIPWMTMFSVWNFPGQVISGVSPGLFTLPADGGNLTNSVKNPSNNTKYMLDGRSGGQTVLRPYQSDTVMEAWEGSSSNFTSISSDYFDVIDNAIGSSLTHTKMGIAGSEFEVVGGVRYPLASSHASLFPGTAQQVSWETYLRMPQGNFVSHLVQSNSGPTVYMMDGGSKHQILWPDALTAWTAPGHGVTQVNDAFLALLSTGAAVGGYTADVSGQLYLVDKTKATVPGALDDAYRAALPPYSASAALMALYQTNGTATGFIKSRAAPQVYLLDDSGARRHLEWASKVEAYGGYQSGITELSPYVLNAIGTAASPQVFVSDGATNYVMDNGKKWTVSNGIKADWGFGTAQTHGDGTLSRFATGGALDNEFITPSGAYVLVRGGAGYATADANIAGAWGVTGAPAMSHSLVPNTIPVFMLTRFVRSSVGGDNRTFVINNGEWFNVSNAQLANLGGVGAPTMSLNPNQAPNSITDWESVVVKSSAGTHYVIDGGGKRFFPHPIIQNQWTNNGAATVPTVTDGFLNLLPTRGHVERTIKGSAPQVYFYENGAKRHIRFSETYHQSYAPFVLVTDQLLNAIPDGPVI